MPALDAGTDSGIAMDAGHDAGSTATESCSYGECWWSTTLDGGCKSAGFPTPDERPSVSPDAPEGTDQGEIYLGWTQLRLGSTEPDGSASDNAWQRFGLDLDGVCTNSSTCAGMDKPSCQSKAMQQPFDGELCRDNTFASLQPVIAKVPEVGDRFGLSEDVFNCALWHGSYNVIVRVTGYNGLANDPSVRVDWYASDGLEMAQGWSCPHDNYRDDYPLWRASSTWRIDKSLLTDATASAGHLPNSTVADPNAYVRGGYLVARIPDGATLRLIGDGMPYRGFPLTVTRAVWTGMLQKAQDGTWHIHDGLTAGVTKKEDLIASFRDIGFCEGGDLDSFYQSMVQYVDENADMLASGDVSPDAPCDAMSYGIAFESAELTPGMPVTVQPLIECCPPGSSISDCMAVCGDGVVGGAEKCDTAIDAKASGACPTSCAPIDACTTQKVVGTGCDAHCEPQPPITMRLPNDGCCPSGADANTDSDCKPMCGNGVIEAGETCDPVSSCPTCSSDNPCLKAVTNGSDCTISCQLTEITSCSNGDKCCPSACNKNTDTDCPSSCGNNVFEPSLGETCEANTSTPCPASCDDGKPCTKDLRTGTASNCNVVCTHVPITTNVSGDGCCLPTANANTDSDCAAVCGNGIIEGSEQCDDGNSVSGDGCVNCMTETPAQICLVKINDDNACSQCSCAQCTDTSLACYNSGSATEIANCRAVIDCGRANHCSGHDCYCGAGVDDLTCLAFGPSGPCQPQIEAAAGAATGDVIAVQSASTNTNTALGRANALAACAVMNCMSQCL